MMLPMFRFRAEDVEAVMRETTSAPIVRWSGCTCASCRRNSPSTVFLARDTRALWIASDVQPRPTVHVVGFVSREEVDGWLDRMATLSPHQMPGFRALVDACWRSLAGASKEPLTGAS